MGRFVRLLSVVLALLLSAAPLAYAEEQGEDTDPSASAQGVPEPFDWASALSGLDVAVANDMVQRYIKENPDAAQDDVEAYLYSAIQDGSIPLDEDGLDAEGSDSSIGPSSLDYADYLPTDTTLLNSEERVVFNSDPIKGLLCLAAAQSANSAMSSNWAIEPKEFHNDNADAFRHATWNALMVYHVGSSYAERFADAHEYGTPDNPPLEFQMDMFNNALGRLIGASITQPDLPDAYISDTVLASVHAGSARRFAGIDFPADLGYLAPTNSSGALRHPSGSLEVFFFTGWQSIGGSTYYFGADGASYTGWQVVGINPCHFDSSGVLLEEKQALSYSSGFITNLESALSPDTGCLEIAGASSASGARLQQYQTNYTVAQLFEFVSAGSGSGAYYIKNKSSGKVLEPAQGSLTSGTPIVQNQLTYALSQQWIIESDMGASGPPFRIVSKAAPALVFDLAGANTANSTTIQLYTRNNTSAQLFWTVGRNPIPNGTYTVQSLLASKVLDVAGGNPNAGANVQVWDRNNSAAQRFTFTLDSSTGYYTISSALSGRVVEVAGGSTEPGANVQIWDSNNTLAQRWVVRKYIDGYYMIINPSSKNVLDVAGGDPNAGANVQVYTRNYTLAQRWEFLGLSSSYSMTETDSDDAPGLNGYALNAGSGDTMDIWAGDGGAEV